jgi:hypothetical protein
MGASSCSVIDAALLRCFGLLALPALGRSADGDCTTTPPTRGVRVPSLPPGTRAGNSDTHIFGGSWRDTRNDDGDGDGVMVTTRG